MTDRNVSVEDFYGEMKKQTTKKAIMKSAKTSPAILNREAMHAENQDDERQAAGVQTTTFAEELMTHCATVSLTDQERTTSRSCCRS